MCVSGQPWPILRLVFFPARVSSSLSPSDPTSAIDTHHRRLRTCAFRPLVVSLPSRLDRPAHTAPSSLLRAFSLPELARFYIFSVLLSNSRADLPPPFSTVPIFSGSLIPVDGLPKSPYSTVLEEPTPQLTRKNPISRPEHIDVSALVPWVLLLL